MNENAESSQEDNNESEKTGKQILRAREDPKPIFLVQSNEYSENAPSFMLETDKGGCPWAKDEKCITVEELRKRIEPWLTALCQSEQLSLLVGSGLSSAVHKMATGEDLQAMNGGKFVNNKYAGHITKEAESTAKDPDRGTGNIENRIRAAIELLRGLEILSKTDSNFKNDFKSLEKSLKTEIEEFAYSIQKTERGIATANNTKRERAFNYLVTFLMSFASRSGTRDRLHIFTTNYDRLIEAGADVAGLHLLDRFVGALSPIFRSSRLDLDIHYNPPGIRGEPRYLEGVARFTKLHGSIDWVDVAGSIRRIAQPFGAQELKPYLKALGLTDADAMRLMIYPNAAKDRETSGYPYVELFRDLAAGCCRPNHTLFTYGYSFGDEHINRVIEDMLTIPSTHLVVIAYDDRPGRIMKSYERIGRPAQISLMIGNHLADLKTLVDWYLPKPAIDQTTYRMADLLKSRLGAEQSDASTSDAKNKNTSNGGDK